MSRPTKRVELVVENAGGVKRSAWPITQGIPFADGELEPGAAVCVVDAEGRPFPTQSTCLATWSRDMKYVKWLLVDFQTDLRADETASFFLEYGEGAETPAPTQPVAVTREEGRIRIDTGVLRLDLRTSPGGYSSVPAVHMARDFLARCWVATEEGWRDVFRGDPGPHLYLVDTHGQRYDSCTAAPPPRITVEDAGPVRVSVCVKGFHASHNGTLICPFTVRIHAFSGRPYLRVFHTFVFDQNPEHLEFSEVGMCFPLDLGNDLRMAFGGEENAHWASQWRRAELLQSSDIAYKVSRDGESYGEGKKNRGWATLTGDHGSAFVAVRDFWQQYPKGYELTQSGMNVQLWPSSCGESLVYHTPWRERPVYFSGQFGEPAAQAASRDEKTVQELIEARPTAPLNLKSFAVNSAEDVRWVEEMVDKYAPDRPASHNDTGTNDGTGAGKTHEIWLRFAGDAIEDEAAEELATAVQEPVIAPADPHYMYRTAATRKVYAGPDPRFEKVDAILDGVTERVAIEPMRLARAWGFWRFGYMCCSHSASPGLAWFLHYHTDPENGLRFTGPYNNEADDPCWGVWTQFLRTGKRRFFIAASNNSRAMGEVGICHAHPFRPEVVGLMHYHNAHQWTGNCSPSHTLNNSLFLHYYLTGDRRMREIALEAADCAVRNQEIAGIISCRHGVLNREFSGPLNCVIEAYLDTWAETYGDLAARSLKWLLRTQEKPGVWATSVFTRGARGDEAVVEGAYLPFNHGGSLFPIFYEGVRHFDGPLLRDTIKAEADLGSPVACAVAYDLTDEPIYAARCKKAVDDWAVHGRNVAELNEQGGDAFFSGIRNGLVSVYKAVTARAMDKDAAAFAEAEKRLEALIEEASKHESPKPPNPTYEPPERSLGILDVRDA